MLLQPVCDIAGNEKGNRNERFYRYGVAHCTCFLFAEKDDVIKDDKEDDFGLD